MIVNVAYLALRGFATSAAGSKSFTELSLRLIKDATGLYLKQNTSLHTEAHTQKRDGELAKV